jgi:hypothetical protein
MGLDYDNLIIKYFDAYFSLFLAKDLSILSFFYKITHQYHWTSHLQPNDFIVFVCLKK